ncbi:hypothetical protein ACIGNX_34565 [Actinosynnema sp. NPDC053489]|uniref:hypothetical protein n=1 Tax=Actinosynnema sp. NPDC053489 TaxID=3363916 RepID=UPI0037CBBD47
MLIELCRLAQERVEDVEDVSDADLYRDIVFSVRRRYSTGDFSAKSAPEFEETAAALVRRLGVGWFAERPSLRSPQAWYSSTGVIPPIRVEDSLPSPAAVVDKPAGALWTSSYLDDGSSAWQFLERAEFGHLDREVYSLHFDADAVSVCTIDSPEDYERLVSTYPRRRSDGGTGVRWSAVAQDYDAVRLSALGLVLAHDVDVPAAGGVARLCGWDSESTAWLRTPPAVEVVPFGGSGPGGGRASVRG